MSGTFNLIPSAEWVDTPAKAQEMGEYLYYHARDGLGVDTETTGLDIARDIPLLMSLSDGNRRFVFWVEQIAYLPYVRDWLLANPELPKIFTRAKFDMHMCANVGINIEGRIEDTLVIDWLYDENRYGRHGLKETARDHCGLKMREFQEIFPMKATVKPSKKNPQGIPGEGPGDAIRRVMNDPVERLKGIEYAGLDAWGSVKVRNWLRERLAGWYMAPQNPTMTLWQHFLIVETEYTRVLFEMERRGITICVGHLRAAAVPMKADLERLEQDIAQLVGWPINPDSPKQLQKYFFEQKGYKPFKMTDGGSSGIKQPSTDYDSLVHFRDTRGCKVAAKMIDQRELAKAKGTYVDGLQRHVDQNLRIHTTLNQHVVVTGRLSSTDPNLQNIPRPGSDKFKLRQAFCAAAGKKLVVADYDQLEMKLMAHFSQDPEMIGAILDGKDLHCYTVALMYGENYDEVYEAKKSEKKGPTERQQELLLKRQSAKATGFGLIYGIGPRKLALQLIEELKLDKPQNENDLKMKIRWAKTLIDKYFGAFPGVKRFIDQTHYACAQTEFVQTLVGRFRRLPGINAKGGGGDDGEDGSGISAEAKRQSVNTIIQGTAADITKAAMIRAEYDPVLIDLGAEMLLQIHDELIFEVDDDDEIVDLTKKRVQAIMEHPFGEGFELSVPLTAGGGSGYTWVEAK